MHTINRSLLAGLPGAFICLLCASFSSAQQEQGRPGQPPPEATPITSDQESATSKPTRRSVTGELFLEPDTYSLDTIRKRVAHATETDILLHAMLRAADSQLWEQAESVTLDRPIRMNAKEAMTFFSRILDSQSFVLTKLEPRGSVLEIVFIQGTSRALVDSRTELKTLAEVLAEPDLVMMVSVVRPLKHLDAPRTSNSLRPFLASTFSGGSRQSPQIGILGNSLLVQGLQHQVASVLRYLDQADVEVKERHDFEQRLRAIEKRLNPSPANSKKRKS